MRSQATLLTDEHTGLFECFDRLAANREKTRPLSTYRVQFNSGFRFVDARELVPYLHALGVSTFYSSPILQARSGSAHGYDITDHGRVNEEIGTIAELHEVSRELRSRGMTFLLDVVPNHMGVGHGSNPWWQDVLQNGRASRFANYFDIDWTPLKPELRNKVLLPVLGNQYGDELESGKLQLQFEDGQFRIQYYDRQLPIDPHTVPIIFESLGTLTLQATQGNEQLLNELRGIIIAFTELPPHDAADADRVTNRQREIPFLVQRFRELVERSPEIRELTNRAVKTTNGTPGDPHSFDLFHKLLEAQPYRLAHWKVSAEEINYRRFFDINELVGIRMEEPQVFAATQQLIRRLLADGTVTGLRIDHPDGLFNPPQYFTRLQMLYAASQCSGPEPRLPIAENGIELDIQNVFGQHETITTHAPLYVVVEKILEPGEELPSDWPVDGTVGYEFANLVNGIFIDIRSRRAFTTTYQRFLGEPLDPDALIYQSKKLIMHSALASEVNVLGHMLDEISSTDRRARDFTRKVLRDAIRETIACFPVYRTYIDERGTITDRDRSYINEAISRAKRKNGSMAQQVFDYLRDVLLLKGTDPGAPIYGYRKQLYFTLKFQQLTGPVMAKGLEDTACYVYNRFISVNEVGGTPKAFGIELEEFHRGNLERAKDWCYSMLTTSTHDTKRSEDVRMRLDVLSEMPRSWAAQAFRWRRANRQRKRPLSDGRTAPDANEEYLLYQTLVGAWPLQMEGDDARADFISRIQQYITKAIHEAKVNLSWVNPDPDYTDRLTDFVQRILTPGGSGRPNTFLNAAEPFIAKIAFFGAVNSLAQTLIKLTAPGVPDIYQGQELWDFSLVDPDNRRKVDFAVRRRYLEEMESRGAADMSGYIVAMLRTWKDGRVKMWVTTRALRLRNELPEVFLSGDYVPIAATDSSRHVVSYARTFGGHTVITAVPRFSYSLLNGEERWPIGEIWAGSALALPGSFAERKFLNTLTGETLQVDKSGNLPCRDVFRHFPVALLVAS